MFPAAAPSIYQSPKCFVSYGTMGYLDTKQAPRKGKPWTAVMSLDFIHKVWTSMDAQNELNTELRLGWSNSTFRGLRCCLSAAEQRSKCPSLLKGSNVAWRYSPRRLFYWVHQKGQAVHSVVKCFWRWPCFQVISWCSRRDRQRLAHYLPCAKVYNWIKSLEIIY